MKSVSSIKTVKNLLSLVGLIVVLITTLFLSSGRLDWGIAWCYICLRVTIAAVSMIRIASENPGLIEERFNPGDEVKTWDRPLANTTTLLLPVTLVIAGLDLRFGWSSELALFIRLSALIIWVLGDVFSKWAAISNRFYSRLVRIQKDRGHTVVTNGPYQYVRHPGYAGALVAGFATPILLGSLWALITGGVLALFLIVRTWLEDKTLQEELSGYMEYAQQTQFRLVPGIW
jgi:protein-S-isoprenylcysteine O-methyltransferase Ste14